MSMRPLSLIGLAPGAGAANYRVRDGARWLLYWLATLVVLYLVGFLVFNGARPFDYFTRLAAMQTASYLVAFCAAAALFLAGNTCVDWLLYPRGEGRSGALGRSFACRVAPLKLATIANVLLLLNMGAGYLRGYPGQHAGFSCIASLFLAAAALAWGCVLGIDRLIRQSRLRMPRPILGSVLCTLLGMLAIWAGVELRGYLNPLRDWQEHLYPRPAETRPGPAQTRPVDATGSGARRPGESGDVVVWA